MNKMFPKCLAVCISLLLSSSVAIPANAGMVELWTEDNFIGGKMTVDHCYADIVDNVYDSGRQDITYVVSVRNSNTPWSDEEIGLIYRGFGTPQFIKHNAADHLRCEAK